MASGGIGRAVAAGSGMTKGITKAKNFGQGLMGRAGFLFTGLKALDMLEQYTDLQDDAEKMKKMEAGLAQRVANAEETLENAKRSPLLSNSGSVQQLEATIGQIRKYLQWLASCGPMLRGVSKHEIFPKLGRFGGFLTDALVALQVDTTLALAGGNGMGGMLLQQVAPQGYNPSGGGPPAGQMLGSLGQYGNTLVDQHHQRLLIPPLEHPQQQMVPKGGIYGGMPPMFPDPKVQTPPQVNGALAGPAHFAGWPNNSEIIAAITRREAVGLDEPIGFERTGWPSRPEVLYPMVMRSQAPAKGRTDPENEERPSNLADVSPMTMYTTAYSTGDAPIDFNEAGSPRNSDDADLPAMGNTPDAVDASTSFDGWTRQLDLVSMTPPQAPSAGARTGYERAAWANFGDPPSFRSLAATAIVGSDGTISPTPSDPVPQTAQKIPGAGADGTKVSNATKQYREALGDGTISPTPSDPVPRTAQKNPRAGADGSKVSHATKKMRDALGIDGRAWSDSLDSSASHSRKQMVGGMRNECAEWLNLPNSHFQATKQMPGVLKPQICYDSAGWSYYYDADTGQCYPTGWKRDPQEYPVASRSSRYG